MENEVYAVLTTADATRQGQNWLKGQLDIANILAGLFLFVGEIDEVGGCVVSWQTDVLIIGGGLAGLTAALAARKKDREVLVIGKGKEGEVSASVLSGGGFMAASNGLTNSDHFLRTWEGGGQIANPKMIETLVTDAQKALSFFEETTGVKFMNDRTGSYRMEGSDALEPPIGNHFLIPLRAAAKQAGISIIGEFSVIELLVNNKRCTGARGLYRDKLININAQAVVLATGGCAGLFSSTDNPPPIAGEGYALALRAGARLRDMEFIQFHALCLRAEALPKVILTNPFPPSLRLVDASHMDLIFAWYGPDATLEKASKLYRDSLTRRLVGLEGGAYLDFSEVTAEEWQKYPLLRMLRKRKYDFAKNRVKVYPVAHYCMGGVVTDPSGRTDVDGLWAAGEVVGGIDGANRLAGNALSECLVFGIRAGEGAALSVSQTAINLPSEIKDRKISEDIDIIENANKYNNEIKRKLRPDYLSDEANLTKLELQLRTGCWKYLGPIRTEAGLILWQTQLCNMWEETENFSCKNNKQAAKIIQLKLRIECAQAIAEAALQRKESLGAHCRID